MPPLAIPSPPVHLLQVPRDVSSASNATEVGLEVVCAWPVSGQYGPGTRVLYYVLIAACVFARKEEWLRNACLAGALLFPAIAALHGIVLAAVHVDGAIDMDVYGAFQLCSIGILTAPLTARMSGTYFKDPRRNIIFLWTGLVLAGLLSITVELFRVQSSTCTEDNTGKPISPDVSQFPYDNANCSLRCSTDTGPFSPIRVGATNEIFVIPAPKKLTFGAATLLAAACCIPAIISILYFWSLILQETWNNRVNGGTDSDRRDETIDGTNGATVGKMLQINGLVRTVLSTVEAPVFAAAILAILILGEKNFFSGPVDHGTEPIASIGQWAPIVGAGFAIFGSLYLFLTADDREQSSPACKCTCHNNESAKRNHSISQSISATNNELFSAGTTTTTTATPEPAHTHPTRVETADIGNRRGINRALMRLATTISIAAHDRLTDYEFKIGRAQDFPEIPAEEQRNEALQQIRDQYNIRRDSNSNLTLSRVGSTNSMASWRGDGERSSTTSRGISPRSSRVSARSRSPPFLLSSSRREEEAPGSAEGHDSPDPLAQPRKRRDTLEVPQPQHGSMRRSPSTSSVSTTAGVAIPGRQGSPAIVISTGDEISVAVSDSSESEPSEALGSSRYERRFTS